MGDGLLYRKVCRNNHSTTKSVRAQMGLGWIHQNVVVCGRIVVLSLGYSSGNAYVMEQSIKRTCEICTSTHCVGCLLLGAKIAQRQTTCKKRGIQIDSIPACISADNFSHPCPWLLIALAMAAVAGLVCNHRFDWTPRGIGKIGPVHT